MDGLIKDERLLTERSDVLKMVALASMQPRPTKGPTKATAPRHRHQNSSFACLPLRPSDYSGDVHYARSMRRMIRWCTKNGENLSDMPRHIREAYMSFQKEMSTGDD